ncbi:unnamed protein product, partial [Discosporangium mesarthrocarpum]
SLTQQVLDGVFKHRYKDVSSTVREEALSAMGRWMLILPKAFLQDATVRYLGWSLSDKSSNVRMAVLQVNLP